MNDKRLTELVMKAATGDLTPEESTELRDLGKQRQAAEDIPRLEKAVEKARAKLAEAEKQLEAARATANPPKRKRTTKPTNPQGDTDGAS